jgi:hypothetical protein
VPCLEDVGFALAAVDTALLLVVCAAWDATLVVLLFDFACIPASLGVGAARDAARATLTLGHDALVTRLLDFAWTLAGVSAI